MRVTGPVLTLAAVGAVAAGVATANVVLTGQPGPPTVEQATGALAREAPLPAPAAPAAPAGTVLYKGWSTDRAVSVDIRVEDGRAKAYVCDDEGIESWTRGAVAQDGPTRLTAGNGDRVEYTVQDGTATGTAAAGGRTWEFTAAREPAGPARAAEPTAAPAPAPVVEPAAPAAPEAPAAPPAGDRSGGGGGY